MPLGEEYSLLEDENSRLKSLLLHGRSYESESAAEDFCCSNSVSYGYTGPEEAGELILPVRTFQREATVAIGGGCADN